MIREARVAAALVRELEAADAALLRAANTFPETRARKDLTNLRRQLAPIVERARSYVEHTTALGLDL